MLLKLYRSRRLRIMIWIGLLAVVCVKGQNIRPEILNHQNWALLDRGDECGDSASDRIIGGKNASLGEYPWIVRLGYGIRQASEESGLVLDFKCGGTIISERYVLTAAHCLHSDDLELIAVRVGEYDADSDPDCLSEGVCAPLVQDIEIEEYIQHSEFVPICEFMCEKPEEQYNNDIALLRLVKPIDFNDYVYPVCLPVYVTQYNTSYEGSTMVVAGWGVEGHWQYGDQSRILQKLSVTVVPLSTCNRKYKPFDFYVTDKQLCTGGELGQDSCAGDSGGPLVKAFSLGGPGRFFLLGIVSFGLTQCAATDTPGVYTKVDQYVEWVLDNVRP